jgi:ubiquinone/menaquinone biosynthesis C-methylase UbiE
MNKDPYLRFEGLYGRLIDPMLDGLRGLGKRMSAPTRGNRVLDVGCGTGAHLDLYRNCGCETHGIDSSPSMLKVAKRRLGKDTVLMIGDATAMPYENQIFDLILCMLLLHEMEESMRNSTIVEMKRVLKPDGRILFIDYHERMPLFLKGWKYKIIIEMIELLAGLRHFRNYRHFLANGGLSRLIGQNGLIVEQKRIVAGGTFGLSIAAHGS